MKSSKIIRVFIGIMCLFILVGCGKKEVNSKKSIEVFSNKPENQIILKKLVSDFEEEHPDIDIVFTSPPDAGTFLRTRLVKNKIPNIVMYAGDNTYSELADVGMLEDLADIGFDNKILPAYKEMAQALQKDKDKLFGVPYATNAAGVIYNVDIFKKYNQKVPETWDEFIKLCDFFKEQGITPIEGTFKDSWTILSIFNPLTGILTDKNFMIERNENRTNFQQGWQQPMKQLVQVMNYTQEDSMGTSYADGIQAFSKSKSAMIINGTWAIPEVRKANQKINVNIFPLPASEVNSENYVTSGIDVMFMVGKDTDNQKESKKFIEFMLKQEHSSEYINDQFAFSAIKGVSQKDPSLSGVSRQIEEGKVNDFVDHFIPNGYDLGAMLSEFTLNQTSKSNEVKKNINDSLKKMDESYSVYNFE